MFDQDDEIIAQRNNDSQYQEVYKYAVDNFGRRAKMNMFALTALEPQSIEDYEKSIELGINIKKIYNLISIFTVGKKTMEGYIKYHPKLIYQDEEGRIFKNDSTLAENMTERTALSHNESIEVSIDEAMEFVLDALWIERETYMVHEINAINQISPEEFHNLYYHITSNKLCKNISFKFCKVSTEISQTLSKYRNTDGTMSDFESTLLAKLKSSAVNAIKYCVLSFDYNGTIFNLSTIGNGEFSLEYDNQNVIFEGPKMKEFLDLFIGNPKVGKNWLEFTLVEELTTFSVRSYPHIIGELLDTNQLRYNFEKIHLTDYGKHLGYAQLNDSDYSDVYMKLLRFTFPDIPNLELYLKRPEPSNSNNWIVSIDGTKETLNDIDLLNRLIIISSEYHQKQLIYKEEQQKEFKKNMSYDSETVFLDTLEEMKNPTKKLWKEMSKAWNSHLKAMPKEERKSINKLIDQYKEKHRPISSVFNGFLRVGGVDLEAEVFQFPDSFKNSTKRF